jgi:1-deoxy-D-xylulose-5-phosphate reductoisomerase
VAAGELVLKAALGRSRIIPVDSEHSAIFQALEGHRHSQIKRLVLTASGGPFRDHKWEELERVTLAEALRHPVWEMGPKVTIDSATMMNKGLEVIEAHWLFGVPPDHIEVLVHPQSIVHSLVEFVDRTMLAQLGLPDMRAPISYALSYPKRMPAHYPSLDLAAVGPLTFYRPDPVRFPCLSLAREALKVGQTLPAVLNAANEVAVSAFLKGEVRFTQIPDLIDKVMSTHRPEKATDLEVILSADRWARAKAGALVASWNGASSA